MGNENLPENANRLPLAGCEFAFSRVVATGDTVPDRSGTFTDFLGLPVADRDNIAFVARESTGRQTIYLESGGARLAVVDSSTPVPGGTDSFDGFGNLCLDNADLLFLGRGRSIQIAGSDVMQQGVYVFDNGAVRTIADIGTPVPGGAGNFRFPTASWIADGLVVFSGSDGGQTSGIYSHGPAGLLAVVDTSMSVPGGTGRYQDFGLPATDGKNAVFQNSNVTEKGVYVRYGASIGVLADTHTPIPNGGGATFVAFGDTHGLRGAETVFNGFGGNRDSDGSFQCRGVYRSHENALSVVADANTPIPQGQGNFHNFPLNGNVLDPATGHVAFEGEDKVSWGRNPEESNASRGQKGIYMSCGGLLQKVIDLTDTLDGKTLADVGLGNRGLGGNQLVFSATFVDGTTAIYRATLRTS